MADADDGSEREKLSLEERLKLSERALEIYRQQLKNEREQTVAVRSMVADKEAIIENLMLRYDLGILSSEDTPVALHTKAETHPKPADDMRVKAEALAQRTILENFELRVCRTTVRTLALVQC